jgi:hypothetical protein
MRPFGTKELDWCYVGSLLLVTTSVAGLARVLWLAYSQGYLAAR